MCPGCAVNEEALSEDTLVRDPVLGLEAEAQLTPQEISVYTAA